MNGNIVLCGFMGCGKTCVGRRAARLMKREFCDLDQYIEQKEGMTISEIFQAFGEEGFREREAQAVREVSKERGMVVACGGGTVLSSRNVEAFHQGGGVILLLNVPLPVLQERLKYDTTRPLLQKPNRNQVIAALYKKRMPQYRAAADLSLRGVAPPWVVAKRIACLAERRLDPGQAPENKKAIQKAEKTERKKKV